MVTLVACHRLNWLELDALVATLTVTFEKVRPLIFRGVVYIPSKSPGYMQFVTVILR